LDVSFWTGDIDWQTMSANADGIYLRCTSGFDIKDVRYDEYVDGVTKTPMLYGAYHFYRNNQSPYQQAMWFLKHYRGGTLPPALDIEDGGDVDLDAIKTWLNVVEEHAGVRPVIYTSKGWWDSRFSGVEWAKDYQLWVANWTSRDYPVIPSDWDTWWLWQYAATKGKPYGARGSVDLNRFNS
jgi:lysozyme